MPRILIIEDELPMRTALEDILRDEGHRVLTAADGADGLTRAAAELPDLVLLDVMMPRADGFSVCRGLRRLGLRMPVLMLTAKSLIDDKVAGLDAGADDYLVKPFNRRELLARVRALLRRGGAGGGPPPERIRFGGVRIDFLRHECLRDGKAVALTPKEFAMLRLLAERPGETVSRGDFLDRVWGYGAYPVTRTVDNHIARLRGKLEEEPANPRFLLTTNKEGYRLDFSSPE